MKIEYNCENKNFKMINELYGILSDRKKMKEKPNSKLKTYFGHVFDWILLYILMVVIDIWINFYVGYSSLLTGCIVFLILYVVFYLFVRYFYINRVANVKTSGVIEFYKEGIFDLNDGVGNFFSWDKVDYVVIGNRTVVIITKVPVCLYYDVSYVDTLLKGVKKYKKDILVVDKRV